MADIVIREEGEELLSTELGDIAHANFMGIVRARNMVGAGFLAMGRLLKDNRDRKYFHVLGYETFEEFLGSPDVTLSRAMAFRLINTVEVFIDKLGRPHEELTAIGIGRLADITPVVEQDPDEWLGKAQVLSRSDLQDEVSEVTGHARKRHSDAPRSTDLRKIHPGEKYVDYVRESPCCVCGKHSTEDAKTNAAHFPTSKGAGAPKDWVIPLCGDCHAEHHKDPVEFMVKYQRQWASWFFWLVSEAFDLTLPDATKRYATKHDETLPEEPPGSPLAIPLLPQKTKSKSKSLPAKMEETSSSGNGPGGSEDSAVLPAASSVVKTRQIWPPADASPAIHDPESPASGVDFRRCPECGYIVSPKDLDETGVCTTSHPPAKKPATAKRRAKKGASA